MARRGAEAQALHHARAVAFDQRVGAGHEVERARQVGGVLQVEQYELFAVAQRRAAGAELGRHRVRGRPRDQRHLGPGLREHVAGERARAQAFELDDLQTLERQCRHAGTGV